MNSPTEQRRCRELYLTPEELNRVISDEELAWGTETNRRFALPN